MWSKVSHKENIHGEKETLLVAKLCCDPQTGRVWRRAWSVRVKSEKKKKTVDTKFLASGMTNRARKSEQIYSMWTNVIAVGSVVVRSLRKKNKQVDRFAPVKVFLHNNLSL